MVLSSELFITGVGLRAEGGYGEVSRDGCGDQHEAGRVPRYEDAGIDVLTIPKTNLTPRMFLTCHSLQVDYRRKKKDVQDPTCTASDKSLRSRFMK